MEYQPLWCCSHPDQAISPLQVCLKICSTDLTPPQCLLSSHAIISPLVNQSYYPEEFIPRRFPQWALLAFRAVRIYAGCPLTTHDEEERTEIPLDQI